MQVVHGLTSTHAANSPKHVRYNLFHPEPHTLSNTVQKEAQRKKTGIDA